MITIRSKFKETSLLNNFPLNSNIFHQNFIRINFKLFCYNVLYLSLFKISLPVADFRKLSFANWFTFFYITCNLLIFSCILQTIFTFRFLMASAQSVSPLANEISSHQIKVASRDTESFLLFCWLSRCEHILCPLG